MRRGAFIEMMYIEYMIDGQRNTIEYERSHPMPAEPYEKETMESSCLFQNGKWRKDVPLAAAMDILARAPVGATLVRVEERDHRLNID